MHPNPIFRKTESAASIDFARQRSFGTLMLNGDETPLVAHIPFLLNEAADEARLHLVRSNPIARALRSTSLEAKLSVLGPDSYISPDWYEVPDQVPTWNYIAVHFIGTLELLPDNALPDLLAAQSEHFESQLAPKPPWTAEKMSDGVMEKMMRAIVPARLSITDMQSTFKLGQNKPESVRLSAAAQVAHHGIGQDIAALGAFMINPPKTTQEES